MNRLSGSRITLAAAVLAGFLAIPPPLEAARVYVTVAPPAPIVEVRVVAPSPKHVWIAGFHRWNGTAYVWVPGRYVLPPHAGQVWVAGHWGHHTVHGHYWVEGRWR